MDGIYQESQESCFQSQLPSQVAHRRFCDVSKSDEQFGKSHLDAEVLEFGGHFGDF